jgi:phosphoribosylformylglycinamidine synthase subunit PurSL
MLWEVEIRPRGHDAEAERILGELRALDDSHVPASGSGRFYLLSGELSRDQTERVARELLADETVEAYRLTEAGQPGANGSEQVVNVLLKPGVMDPVAESVERAVADLGLPSPRVHTGRRFFFRPALPDATLQRLEQTTLANDAIEQVLVGPLPASAWAAAGAPYHFRLITIPIRDMDDAALAKLSKVGQLYLSLDEMQTIREHFRDLGRDATDAELETLAQTWSEHCSHKTLKGKIEFSGPDGTIFYDNLLKQTVFKATQEIRKRLGKDDGCVSVFADNAGVVKFDEQHHVCFKVETHNHPSAIEPYGGANTGLGGVIRDVLGTGLGGEPICNTDVFCFAPPDLPPLAEGGQGGLPPGVLHPKRVMRGVVAGVRDYGNRMGIPTVNGAICFDERYLANPLVFCGTVGLIPVGKEHKQPRPGDLIVAVGGRTGRDGIHGATFSSAELTHESEQISGGAVQIGNAITEKKMLDVLLVARDRGLFTAITDCGAGGFSSAVGEMGAEIGAEVHLERAPLKYEGLSYTEIWISEAQERMVLAVRPAKWPELRDLCASEDVEATVIGEYKPTGRLQLFYQGNRVADLDMHFLHEGRPPVVRKAEWRGRGVDPPSTNQPKGPKLGGLTPSAHQGEAPYNDTLLKILSSLNVCSKEWVIRQYDHEVQGGSVIKPLIGVKNDGPSDAAVIMPVRGSTRGLAIGCGINPRYGDIDPYWMAASAIDEAVRNVVAVGADPSRIALLDNFCWGNTDRPETLGSLVRAAEACRDVALAYGTPFISGKDSLNNEFHAGDTHISIPPTLLISAIGIVPDVRKCVTMDLKRPESALFRIGETTGELGGSHYHLVNGLHGGTVPHLNLARAVQIFRAIHEAICRGLVVSCHDVSEGGVAAALAEMCLAGGCGAWADLTLDSCAPEERLFCESNTRFLVEVEDRHAAQFCEILDGLPFERIGVVDATPNLIINVEDDDMICLALADLKDAWQRPLRW